MESVIEIIGVKRAEVHTVHGNEMATVRGRVISLVRLGNVLTFHRGHAGRGSERGPKTSQALETATVVVRDLGSEIGLIVDRVLGEQDVVIKSIAENYGNVRGIAGASILGDGRVAMILDMSALIAALSQRTVRTQQRSKVAMTEVSQTAGVDNAVLHEFFASATHDASAAMCRWTDGLIHVTLDEVREVGLEEIGEALERGRRAADDGGAGHRRRGGRKPGSRLRRSTTAGSSPHRCWAARPASNPCWSDLEKSALTETGNILGCAYINALTRLVGIDLMPSAPYFIQDFGASVLQQAVATQSLGSDRLLLCQIGFRRMNQELDWRVVFLPTQGMQDAMRRSLLAAPWNLDLACHRPRLQTDTMSISTAQLSATTTLVGMGQTAFARAPDRMKAILGSCVALVLYHPIRKTAAMVHVVLPESAGRSGAAGKFADTSVSGILDVFAQHGAPACAT